jgi:hypothetical protein
MRLPVPGKMIFSRETSPLVRTPLHATEELVRFEGLVDLFVSLQIFGGDEAFATVYANAIFWAVPSSVVAARA